MLNFKKAIKILSSCSNVWHILFTRSAHSLPKTDFKTFPGFKVNGNCTHGGGLPSLNALLVIFLGIRLNKYPKYNHFCILITLESFQKSPYWNTSTCLDIIKVHIIKKRHNWTSQKLRGADVRALLIGV